MKNKLEKVDVTKPEEMVQIGPRIPKSLKTQLELIAVREGRDTQDIVKECLAEYAKVHGDGNPVYALDQWVQEPKFKAVPAFLTNMDNWYDYLQNCSMDEREEIYSKAGAIKRMMEQRGLT